MTESRFSAFTGRELALIARAFYAAAEEGEPVTLDLAAEMAAEFRERGVDVPLPYGWGTESPRRWLVKDSPFGFGGTDLPAWLNAHPEWREDADEHA